MSRRSSKASRVAYMEEEDDLGNVIGGTTYAASAAPSPNKERMNTSKSRRNESPGPIHGHTDSDSTAHARHVSRSKPTRERERERDQRDRERERERERERGRDQRDRDRDRDRAERDRAERDRSVPPNKKSITLTRTPSARHARTAPEIDASHHHRRPRDDAAYYGLDPESVTSTSSRPRSKTAAPRPGAGYTRPPVSNSRYRTIPPPSQYQPPPSQYQPPPLQYKPPPSQYKPATSQYQPPPSQYQPPPSQYQPPPSQYPLSSMAPPPPPPFAAGPPPSRTPQPWQAPPSHRYSMGPPAPPHSLPPLTAEPMYSESFPRQQSLQQNLQHRFELARPQTSMGYRPPPPDYGSVEQYHPEERLIPDMRRLSLSMRPSSARPVLHDSPFAPPTHAPPQSQQLSEYNRYDDDLYDDSDSRYPDTDSFLDLPPASYVPRARRPSLGPSQLGYDLKPYTGDTGHRSNRERRDSFYGTRSSSSGAGLEDKLRQASSYQEEISGGVRLTAETLHEANRVDGPRSRSTRSSGSRDESDWRQSATTRTTRSSNEEDRTMKVRGPAFIRMGETEVQCEMGAEVDITPNGILASRRSDRSSYIEDDRRSRFDRPALRSRAASQTGSFAPQTIAPYGYSYGNGQDYTRLPYGH